MEKFLKPEIFVRDTYYSIAVKENENSHTAIVNHCDIANSEMITFKHEMGGLMEPSIFHEECKEAEKWFRDWYATQ